MSDPQHPAMPSEPASNEAEVDLLRARRWIERELDTFHAAAKEERLRDETERSAFFVAWMAVFLPEAFSSRVKALLRDRLDDYRNDEKYPYRWYRTLGLECAAFALGGSRWEFDRVLVNLDHGNSNLRPPALWACGLVAERLAFDDADLRQRVDNSLQNSLMDCVSVATMFVATVGDALDKREWAKGRLAGGNGNPWEKEWLRQVADGLSVPNQLVAELGRIGHHALSVLARAGSVGTPAASHQIELPVQVSSSTFLERMDRHPLLGPIVEIR